MRLLTARAAALALMAMIAVCSSGCSDDTAKPAGEKSPNGDLTAPEDCITNLLVSYELRDIDRYKQVLHVDYLWYGKKWGVFGDDVDVLDYEQDVALTDQLFNSAVMLDLEIDPGTWLEIEKIGEDSCAGCWQTDRVYRIQVQLPGDETIYTGHGLARLVVIPIDNDGTTEYRIFRGYDLDYY
jgi:hypothetical protein